MRCPGCGGPLVPDELQLGVYQCAQCGEVEVDGEGAYVRGRFYEFEDDEDGNSDPTEEWLEPGEGGPTWEDVLAADDLVSPLDD